MPDNDPIDWNTPYDKTTVHKFGARGSPTYEQEKTFINPQTGETRIERIEIAFCECGKRLTADGDLASQDIHRCCNCETIACGTCHVRHNSQSWCPTCARREYALDKRVFVSLLYLKHGFLDPEDLLQVETLGDEPIEVTIDRTATVLTEHDYLTEDGDLTTDGNEAVTVGKQLYEEDNDIQSLLQKIRIQEVANNGG